ncbi:hypothetical protein N0V84_003231 [Fusarium piperis]|uniref:Uncharacterized protein n=1 Tax=Fusarium piperis TaxID=1435070 RepID=A0A9W9BRE1_9HYPO|nr:hypothetical protein N0V84_003231 [Fusarium piperis]
MEELVQTAPQQPKPKSSIRPHAPSLELKVEGSEQGSSLTRLGKREIGSDNDNNEHQPKRVRLTRKNLPLFNKMTRKKGSNKALESSAPESTAKSSTTKTVSTTSSGFADQAYKNNILHPLQCKLPTNLEHLHKRYFRSRATASPSASEYESYANIVGDAPNKATMGIEVDQRLLKKYNDKGYYRVLDHAFTGFPKDVGFNNNLSAPQPDFVEGLKRQEYDPFPVDEQVNGAKLYKDNPLSLVLPRLAGEWKGPGMDMAKAKLQSAYDGAALVFARN